MPEKPRPWKADPKRGDRRAPIAHRGHGGLRFRLGSRQCQRSGGWLWQAVHEGPQCHGPRRLWQEHRETCVRGSPGTSIYDPGLWSKFKSAKNYCQCTRWPDAQVVLSSTTFGSMTPMTPLVWRLTWLTRQNVTHWWCDSDHLLHTQIYKEKEIDVPFLVSGSSYFSWA